jgi:hypothetical protein
MFNLFYNLGAMVKSLRNLSLYFFDIEFTRVKTPFDFGEELGYLFWNLFYPAEDYLEMVLAN